MNSCNICNKAQLQACVTPCTAKIDNTHDINSVHLGKVVILFVLTRYHYMYGFHSLTHLIHPLPLSLEVIPAKAFSVQLSIIQNIQYLLIPS